MSTFGPTVPDRDTSLLEVLPTSNYGVSTILTLGWPFAGVAYRPVLSWDVSTIPTGVTVNSATLTLKVQATGLTTPQPGTVYPLTRRFTEGTEVGGTANSGATWNKFNSAGEGGNNWTTAGGDYDAAFDSPFTSPTTVTTVVIDVTGAVAKALADYRDVDFISLVMMMDAVLGANQTCAFWSRDAGTPADRPTLEIDYTLAPTITLPDEAGFLGVLRSRTPRRFKKRRVIGRVSRIIAPPLGRSRYRQRFIGLWRAFNAAVYRIYWQAGSPSAAGGTPTATDAALPVDIAGPFADGAWYLSVSWFNGVLDSGFLPIGPAGETYLRFDFLSGVPITAAPRAPVSFAAELLPDHDARIHAVYAEDADERADEWVIYTVVDPDPAADPFIDANRETEPMGSSGVALLRHVSPACNYTGLYLIVLVRTSRNGVESENVTPFVIAGDSTGPAAPLGFTQWSGDPPAE